MKKATRTKFRGGKKRACKKASPGRNGMIGKKTRILDERHHNGLVLARNMLIELMDISFDCERIDDCLEALRAIKAARRCIESFR